MLIAQGVPRWLVRFKGYGPNDDEWCDYENIGFVAFSLFILVFLIYKLHCRKTAVGLLYKFHRDPGNNVPPLSEVVSSVVPDIAADDDDDESSEDSEYQESGSGVPSSAPTRRPSRRIPSPLSRLEDLRIAGRS